MQKSSTLGDIADKGSTSGFDYLRIILAVSVMAWHSAGIVYGRDFAIYLASTPLGNVIFLILPAFFALSGFLVTSSLMRSRTLVEFMGLRLLRLIPALAVEIFLSALLLGPILTSFNISDYFRDSGFRAYFLNILGIIHYQLPGVFINNPIPTIVNGSLWTVPYELECYIAVGGLWLLRQRGNGYAALLLLGLWCGLLLTLLTFGRYEPIGADALNGRLLVAYFLAGVVLYLFRYRIAADWKMFAIATILAPLMVKFRIAIFLSPLIIAYLTVYIGLLQPPKLPIIFSGDYSYGIYLYAFPIQQSVYQLIPASHNWTSHFILSLALTSLLATFSWHAIERPTLKLKKYLRRENPTALPNQKSAIWVKHFAWLPIKAPLIKIDEHNAKSVSSLSIPPKHEWVWLTWIERRHSPESNEYRRPIDPTTD